MEKNKTVADFLAKVKAQKIEQLLGIELDLKYWNSFMSKVKEEELRKELEVEQTRKVLNDEGKIIQDNRDFGKITELSKKIDEIKKITDEILRLNSMKEKIVVYLNYVQNPNKETLEALNKISQL